MKERLYIRGGKVLRGELHIPAAKNAALPIIACCLLIRDTVRIRNCPKIADICAMAEILRFLGASIAWDGDTLVVDCTNAVSRPVPNELTCGIRSSVFLLGPILAGFGHAEISYPGGCEIGLRPIDLHIYGLKCLGVQVTESGGILQCDGEVKGGVVDLDFPSVGATENLMMAGALGKGKTVIRNAAREPEIIDLQNFINAFGGKVSGAGTGVVTVEGVHAFHGGEYAPIGDRIAAATYLCAAAVTGGNVRVNGVQPEYMSAVLQKLRRAGCAVSEHEQSVVLSAGALRAVHKIETQPFPGFPTDMQPQWTATMSVASGSGCVVENVFENRFKYTQQLNKMGANILVRDRVAVVRGVPKLYGAPVLAEDLRGGAALVIAALCAEGDTVIDGVEHIDRGYEHIETALGMLGASVSRQTTVNRGEFAQKT